MGTSKFLSQVVEIVRTHTKPLQEAQISVLQGPRENQVDSKSYHFGGHHHLAFSKRPDSHNIPGSVALYPGCLAARSGGHCQNMYSLLLQSLLCVLRRKLTPLKGSRSRAMRDWRLRVGRHGARDKGHTGDCSGRKEVFMALGHTYHAGTRRNRCLKGQTVETETASNCLVHVWYEVDVLVQIWGLVGVGVEELGHWKRQIPRLFESRGLHNKGQTRSKHVGVLAVQL